MEKKSTQNDILPAFSLTQSQMLMWTGQEMNPEAPLYNMVLIFDLKGRIDVPCFKSAFQALIDHSDAMRTVFSVENNLPHQIILPELRYELEFLDWSVNPNAVIDLKPWAEKRSQKLLDLSECAFDSALVKLNDDHFTWFFNQHHLITDAWAVSVLNKALAGFYQLAIDEKLTEARSLPAFADYIAFENTSKSDPAKTDVHRYWNEKLRLLPNPPKLYGHQNTEGTTRTNRVELDLGPERSARLRALTKEPDLRAWTEHLSLFNIFTTTLFVYLYRVSGQGKLSIGTPAHNRPTPDFKQTPGVFIEIFPLFAEVEEHDSINDLIQKIKTETNGFLRYAQPGFSSPELSRQFNVILNYIHAEFNDFLDIPMQSEWIHPGHCDPRHHLRIQVHDFDASGTIMLYFDFNNSVFGESLQHNSPYHFLKILDTIIENRNQSISDVDLLSAKEKEEIVQLINQDKRLGQKRNVVELFEARVNDFPNRIALLEKGIELNYKEVNSKANQLARYLIENGIKLGDRVALYLKRSIDFMVSVLGVLKAGATYVPIASNYPFERVSYMIKDSGATIVLTHKDLGKSLQNIAVPVIHLGEDKEFINQKEIFGTELRISPDSLAYIMYTSGSTGQPKGVAISHNALTNYVVWASEKYCDIESPVFPLFTMTGFDLTVTSIFVPLISGGSVMIYEESNTGADLSLIDVIEDNAVDVIKLTPSHLALLKGRDLSHSRLQTMIVGGEDFKVELAKVTKKAFGENLKIFNEYGPTEATVGCVLYQYNEQVDLGDSVPIGLPTPGMIVYVLNESGKRVPAGVPGELYISGIGLADGYWNNNALTENSFHPNPFDPGTKFYRSGDLVRLNSDGQLEYLGRKDQQVKVGGIRVEMGEIESALSTFPGIEETVVVLNDRTIAISGHDVQFCTSCGLPSNYPDAHYDENGVCHLCLSFENYQKKAKQYFKTMDDLKAVFEASKEKNKGEYDCMALLSGGKDSTYALGQLVEMGLNVLAFTLDNGYISVQALDNVRRVVTELGVDHIVGQTESMNTIFVDSLRRHSNVCNGCFKTIYTLSTKIALEKGIPYIVTGLSRGQFFETRLTEELFWSDEVDVDKIDRTILNARKAYHRVDDAVCKTLDVSMFEDDDVFEKVQFLDFYRYSDVHLDEMLSYLDMRLPWVRPTDTGRSTNCVINQVGIYVHKKEKGYNNYAFPYSWDVRMGHKTRDAALEEINEEVDELEVKRIMSEIGYSVADQSRTEEKSLVAYYVGLKHVPGSELRTYLGRYLPDYMVPKHFIQLDEMPLSLNGKIDRSALPQPGDSRSEDRVEYIAPQSEIEEMLERIWSEVLQIPKIGINDNFLDLGGHSLAAIRLVARINEAFELELSLNKVFEFPTIATLGNHIEETIIKLLEEMGE